MKRRSVALFGSCLLMAAGAAAQTKPTTWTAPSADQVNAIYPDDDCRIQGVDGSVKSLRIS